MFTSIFAVCIIIASEEWPCVSFALNHQRVWCGNVAFQAPRLYVGNAEDSLQPVVHFTFPFL